MIVSRRVLISAALCALALMGSATPALAHTELTAAEPAAGSTVSSPPDAVVLYFDEAVGADLGSVRVVGPGGARADHGHVLTRTNVVRVPLKPHLTEGTYVVLWRVLSDDGHAVSGRFTFAVGRASVTPRAELTSAPASTRDLNAAGRLLAYAGLILFAGAMLVVAFAWPGGCSDPSVRRLVLGGWALAVFGSLLGYLMQGPNAAALGPAAVLSEPRLLLDIAHTRSGQLTIARVVGLLAVTPTGGLRLLVGGGPARRGLLLVGLAALAATWSASGHAGTRSPEALFVSVDVVHVLAASLWLGGLCVVLVALLRSRDLASTAAAWSRTALIAVIVLTASGTVTAVADVGSRHALLHSRYGHVLMAKVALVVVMVAVGALGRTVVQRRSYGLLHLTIRHEIALGAAVVLVTTALVATPPP